MEQVVQTRKSVSERTIVHRILSFLQYSMVFPTFSASGGLFSLYSESSAMTSFCYN